MRYNDTYLIQSGLKSLGYNPGTIDGIEGPNTRRAVEKFKSDKLGDFSGPPKPNAKTSFYGESGNESNLKRVTLPWRMEIVGMSGQYRTTIRMHRLCADRFIKALKAITNAIGERGIVAYGLDKFGGDYVNRKSRGGSSTSDHAWGIAVDLNPDANGNHTRWTPDKVAGNGTKQMSKQIVQIFKDHGFSVGFPSSGGNRRDMMHIAAVDR